MRKENRYENEKERLNELLENAAKIIVEKHLSIMPPKDKPTT